jgi:V-type H+-transporting ATPase 21kDa proteolipid subunit
VYWQQAEYTGFCMLAIGLVVGLSNLACGISVGVIGSSTALTHAQTPQTFVSMLIVQIFSSALGLYGVIIGIIMANQLKWPALTN